MRWKWKVNSSFFRKQIGSKLEPVNYFSSIRCLEIHEIKKITEYNLLIIYFLKKKHVNLLSENNSNRQKAYDKHDVGCYVPYNGTSRHYYCA